MEWWTHLGLGGSALACRELPSNGIIRDFVRCSVWRNFFSGRRMTVEVSGEVSANQHVRSSNS